MSYNQMKEISTLAEKQGIELKTILEFIKFAKDINYEN